MIEDNTQHYLQLNPEKEPYLIELINFVQT